jgi:uroporphyrinogen decarboxylase
MTHRDRILKAIRFEGPDRIPFTFSTMPAALLCHGEPLLDLLKAHPNSFYEVGDDFKMPERDTANYDADGNYFKEVTDDWGSVWHYYADGFSGEVKNSPLEDWAALESYKIPEVDESPEAIETMRAGMDDQQARGFVRWGHAGQLYERMQFLRGTENLIFDIADSKAEVEILADRIMDEFLLPNIRKSVAAGADIVGFVDDWGTQLSLLINPKTWRRVFKPRYKKMFDLVHEGGAHTWMHSDGMILEIIPDLIEIGLDVINPQVNCIDMAQLKSLIDHKMCIVPDSDRQQRVPFGTPAEIREYVETLHKTFSSPDGGMIYHGTLIGNEPLENAEALLKAFEEFSTP